MSDADQSAGTLTLEPPVTGRLCAADCGLTVPVGRSYCSTACRNRDDRHDTPEVSGDE